MCEELINIVQFCESDHWKWMLVASFEGSTISVWWQNMDAYRFTISHHYILSKTKEEHPITYTLKDKTGNRKFYEGFYINLYKVTMSFV